MQSVKAKSELELQLELRIVDSVLANRRLLVGVVSRVTLDESPLEGTDNGVYSQTFRLKKGADKTITVVATDWAGNETRRKIRLSLIDATIEGTVKLNGAPDVALSIDALAKRPR